jgi:hypothetical protein
MRLPRVSARLGTLLALSPLAAAQGQLHTVDGSLAGGRLGYSLVRFHDLDGDGWREFLAGSPGLTIGVGGRVGILSGRHLAQGTGVLVKGWIQGVDESFGFSLVGLDDFDGDGDRDFAVGAPGHGVGPVFPTADGQVSIWDSSGTLQGEILGPTSGEQLGYAMALVGDLNGDGFKDLLAGSPQFSGGIPTVNWCGKAAVYSGKSLLQNNAVVLRAHLGDEVNESFGRSLATGFFDGDSIVDYAVGAPNRTNSGGVFGSGRVSVYSGATGALIRTIHGAAGAQLGASLSGGLDVTGDGVHDLVIGAPMAGTNGAGSGSVFVYSGAALGGGGILLPSMTWHGPSAGAHFGAAVAVVQDLNGDGRADVLAGAPDYEFFPFGQDNGMFRCFSGQTGELLGHRTGQNDEHLGGAFASADTWDGKPGWEFLVGSPQSELGGTDSGRVASYSIFPNTPTTYCTAKVNSQGCTPAISGSGQPSVAPGVTFSVKAASVLNNTPGILLYALDAAASPFQGGFLCVGAPFKRTSGVFSGGSPVGTDCTGVLSFEFNALIQSGVDATLVPGQEVFSQFWSRDVASPGGSCLTGGMRFLIHPCDSRAMCRLTPRSQGRRGRAVVPRRLARRSSSLVYRDAVLRRRAVDPGRSTNRSSVLSSCRSAKRLRMTWSFREQTRNTRFRRSCEVSITLHDLARERMQRV